MHERGPKTTVNCEPYDWKAKPEPPKEPKTVHRLKDNSWGEAGEGVDSQKNNPRWRTVKDEGRQ